MSSIRWFAVFAALSGSAFAQVKPDAVLLRMPDVSQSEIVFRYANDLWLVDKHGGPARPLSSPPGAESLPKFSPDGRKVACVASYDGARELYVLDVAGGVPLRITHHPDREMLCDWHPDGRSILFSSTMQSGQDGAPKIFRVPAQGGQPTALPVPYGLFASLDDSGAWLAYTPLTQSEFRTWKRYQGGMAQDIWLFHLTTFESRRLTDFAGTDALPMWHANEVYFLSDRGSDGHTNLWKSDARGQKFVQVTNFIDDDVRFPSVGPADIVFEHGGRIMRYEFASGRSVAVEITIPGDRPRLAPRTHSVEDRVADIDVGPHGRRVAVEARGDVFTVSATEGATRNLTNSDGVAERGPAWSPDGQWIAYFSDRSGEYELALRRADGRAFRWPGPTANTDADVEEKTLTSIGPGWKEAPQWAPDSKSLVFANEAGELWHLVVATSELKKLATNPSGDPFTVDWSPDSRWLTFSVRHPSTRLSAIYLYDLAESALHSVTSGRFDDRDPVFDRNGEWLYFVSSRTFEPIYAELDETWVYTNSANLMAVPLRKDVKNVLAATDLDETAPAEDDAEDDDSEDDEHSKDAKPVQIDVVDFESRILELPVDPGVLGSLAGAEGRVYYLRGPRAGSQRPPQEDDEDEEPHGSTLVEFTLSDDASEREEKTVLADVSGFQLAPHGEKLLVQLADESVAIIDAAPDAKDPEKIDFSGMSAEIDPRREWEQILADAYRITRDFFYEPTMHGHDWKAIYARYQRALAHATNRDDLDYLLGEMIAELNVGHAYNAGGPGIPERAPEGPQTGLLGCDFELAEGAYRIAHIVRGAPGETDGRSPLAEPGIDVREGDFLLAVDGAKVDVSKDVFAAFVGKAGRATELTVNSVPRIDVNARRVLVETLEDDSEVRYREWVETNRRFVDTMSGGRIGYIHVPDTTRRGQRELVRQFLSQYQKDALVIDERWNGGGQVPTRFIELLNRPRTNSWAVRHGEDWQWPPIAHDGPKAMLINGSAGSGGDAFPYYFRQAKLGPLIGMRTWGGLVGLSGNPSFIDGSSITVPRFAFYETDGTWGVEGFGVAPDIEVVDDPGKMVHGEDPQLLAGVKYLMEALETWKFVRPARPAPPDRRGSGVTPADR
jgi:tricorn protease